MLERVKRWFKGKTNFWRYHGDIEPGMVFVSFARKDNPFEDVTRYKVTAVKNGFVQYQYVFA